MGRGEPSVEGVFVAEVFDAADFDFLEVCAGVEEPVGGGGVVELTSSGGFSSLFFEHGDRDSPGDLAGDVPVLEVFEVGNEGGLFRGGVKGNFVVF